MLPKNLSQSWKYSELCETKENLCAYSSKGRQIGRNGQPQVFENKLCTIFGATTNLEIGDDREAV